MSSDESVARRHLCGFEIRRSLLELGWAPPSDPPLGVLIRGVTQKLIPLAEHRGRTAFEHRTPIGGSFPDYTERRAIRSRAADPDALIVFTDELHTAQVWQWTERQRGGPAVYREYAFRPGDSGLALLRTLTFLAAAPAPLDAVTDAGMGEVASVLLPALLRRVRRRCPAAFRAGGALERWRTAPDPYSLARQMIEGTEDPALVRAFWRALTDLRVLDPACDPGNRLLAAMEILAFLRDACLERMGSFVGDLDRSRAPHRPEKLRDFRRLLARAHDTRRSPDRRHFIRGAVLRENLFGVGRSEAAIQELLHRLPEDPVAEILNFRVGNPRLGFASAAEVERATCGIEGTKQVLRQIEEAAETLGRAAALLRDSRTAAGDKVALRRAAIEIRDRMDALGAELDRFAAAHGVSPEDPATVREWSAANRPVHLWTEFAGVGMRGGFDLVLRPVASVSPTDGAIEQRSATAPILPRPRRSPPLAWETHAPFGDDSSTPGETLQPADTYHSIPHGSPEYPTALHATLGERAPAVLFARGDPALLDRSLLALFCSVQTPGALLLRTLDFARALRDTGVPTISGFQSPLEREALALLLHGTQPVVVCPAREIEGMRLPSAWREPLEQGRLLLLSRWEKPRRPTASMARARNEMVAALAERIFVPYAAPGGKTFALARQAIERGTPVFTFEDDLNADLLLLGARPAATL